MDVFFFVRLQYGIYLVYRHLPKRKTSYLPSVPTNQLKVPSHPYRKIVFEIYYIHRHVTRIICMHMYRLAFSVHLFYFFGGFVVNLNSGTQLRSHLELDLRLLRRPEIMWAFGVTMSGIYCIQCQHPDGGEVLKG